LKLTVSRSASASGDMYDFLVRVPHGSGSRENAENSDTYKLGMLGKVVPVPTLTRFADRADARSYP